MQKFSVSVCRRDAKIATCALLHCTPPKGSVTTIYTAVREKAKKKLIYTLTQLSLLSGTDFAVG